MKGFLMFLGTGSSMGIPVIGCSCRICHSGTIQHQRLRPSVLITIGGRYYLIDPGPDFRQQALKTHLNRLDGVLITHTHFDHIGGLDELRCYYLLQQKPLPLFLSRYSFLTLQQRYPYFFESQEDTKTLSAQFHFHVFDDWYGEAVFEGIKIRYVTYYQGPTHVNGFIIGNTAYCTDLKTYRHDMIEAMQGVSTLIINAAPDSSMHVSMEEAIALGRKLGVEMIYLTHLSHDVDPDGMKLPNGVSLAYDGLQLPLTR